MNLPCDAGFVSYPPFRKAGKTFIKDFAKLESLFNYEPLAYTIFDENTLLEYCRLIAEKKYWFIGTDMRLPELFDRYLKSVSKTTNQGIAIYLYANTDKMHYIGPGQKTENLNIP